MLRISRRSAGQHAIVKKPGIDGSSCLCCVPNAWSHGMLEIRLMQLSARCNAFYIDAWLNW
jgi:hypothetical protein